FPFAGDDVLVDHDSSPVPAPTVCHCQRFAPWVFAITRQASSPYAAAESGVKPRLWANVMWPAIRGAARAASPPALPKAAAGCLARALRARGTPGRYISITLEPRPSQEGRRLRPNGGHVQCGPS